MKGVDERTQLVGRNRLELLLFRLGTTQRFAINVFKVREVIRAPKLTRLPNSPSQVVGVARLRGATISGRIRASCFSASARAASVAA